MGSHTTGSIDWKRICQNVSEPCRARSGAITHHLTFISARRGHVCKWHSPEEAISICKVRSLSTNGPVTHIVQATRSTDSRLLLDERSGDEDGHYDGEQAGGAVTDYPGAKTARPRSNETIMQRSSGTHLPIALWSPNRRRRGIRRKHGKPMAGSFHQGPSSHS